MWQQEARAFLQNFTPHLSLTDLTGDQLRKVRVVRCVREWDLFGAQFVKEARKWGILSIDTESKLKEAAPAHLFPAGCSKSQKRKIKKRFRDLERRAHAPSYSLPLFPPSPNCR